MTKSDLLSFSRCEKGYSQGYGLLKGKTRSVFAIERLLILRRVALLATKEKQYKKDSIETRSLLKRYGTTSDIIIAKKNIRGFDARGILPKRSNFIGISSYVGGEFLDGKLDIISLSNNSVIGEFIHVHQYKKHFISKEEPSLEVFIQAYLAYGQYGLPVVVTQFSMDNSYSWGFTTEEDLPHLFAIGASTPSQYFAIEDIVTEIENKIKETKRRLEEINKGSEPHSSFNSFCEYCPLLKECTKAAAAQKDENTEAIAQKLSFATALVKQAKKELKEKIGTEPGVVKFDTIQIITKESISKTPVFVGIGTGSKLSKERLLAKLEPNGPLLKKLYKNGDGGLEIKYNKATCKILISEFRKKGINLAFKETSRVSFSYK